MKSSVTVSLVPEARGGPFVFWDDLEGACRKAADLGFDGIEVFAPSAAALGDFGAVLREHGLELAALGTGAGWVLEKLSLTSAAPGNREEARRFIEGMIDRASEFGSRVIIGSMQGRAEGSVSREEGLKLLADALQELGAYAARKGVVLLYEFLNRYETNLLNRVEDVVPFIKGANCPGVKVLADLFHMNIEEADMAAALLQLGGMLGHVHFVDSNRRAAGMGHIPFPPVMDALKRLNYTGYLSAEALAYPNPAEAAARTMRMFRSLTA